MNHPTVGRLPEGAIVERSPPSIAPSSHLKLQLQEADFTTAARIVEAVNRRFAVAGSPSQKPESSAVVAVDVPAAYSSRPMEFVGGNRKPAVESSRREKIVINERTGTIVLGKDVRITPMAIMHGALTVEVQTAFNVNSRRRSRPERPRS